MCGRVQVRRDQHRTEAVLTALLDPGHERGVIARGLAAGQHCLHFLVGRLDAVQAADLDRIGIAAACGIRSTDSCAFRNAGVPALAVEVGMQEDKTETGPA
jgi:hypothetical protein